MASDLVHSATSEKLTEMDWMKNIEICELVANDPRVAKDVVKAIKKRLSNKNPNVQLYTIMLLEMLMNNLGETVHRQVIDAALIPILVKIVKKKTDFPVREKIFLLLDATQTSVGGASGKFPQYYNAYYELVVVDDGYSADQSAGVQFPGRPRAVVSSNDSSSGATQVNLTIRDVATVNQHRSIPREESQLNQQKQESKPSGRKPSIGVWPAKLTVRDVASANQETGRPQEEPQSKERKKDHQVSPEPSVIQKASAALEVLREVLNTISIENPEVAKDEFTRDLVEQCSFHKQQVMQLAMNSRDETRVAQAIELNEQLEGVLTRHDSLLLCRPTSTEHVVAQNGTLSNRHDKPTSNRPASTTNLVGHEPEEEEEEEEAEQLYRRIRKGKAHASPEVETNSAEKPFGLLGSPIPGEKLHRPLIRPLTVEPPSHESKAPSPATIIPPPPAKHSERKRFFQEKKGDGNGLAGHIRGLSLHSRSPSSSGLSAVIDFRSRFEAVAVDFREEMNARIQAPASSSTFPIPSVPSTSSATRRIGLSLPRESCTSQRSFRIRMEASMNCISSKHATAGRFSLGWSTAASSLWGPLIKCSLPVGALLTSTVPGFSAAPFIGNEKVGVLLLNLGGPETLEDVQPFLFNLFADPAEELRKALNAKNIPAKVYVGMRYWHPFTEEAIEQIKRDGITKLVVLPLYPQFSISTSGSSLRLLESIFREDEYLVNMQHTVIPSWYQREGYIKAMVDLIEQELAKFDRPEEVMMFFSAHGVPLAYVEEAGDPYKAEMEECVDLIMEELEKRGKNNSFTLAYQSRVGPVEWLKPYTDETIVDLGQKGVKSLLAVPISFVSEIGRETLEEIDVEYKELALKSGIENWGRVPALGCEPTFISDLADAVIESLPYVGAMAVSNLEARQGVIWGKRKGWGNHCKDCFFANSSKYEDREPFEETASLVPLGSVEELLAAYDSQRRELPPPVTFWEWGWTKSAETWNGRIAMLAVVLLLVREVTTGEGFLHQWGVLPLSH
ncbi:Ferrochelatase-2, chloroplastic-like protein [Drosera capensis]